MYRIGIIGSENTHATAFTNILNVRQDAEFADLRVVAVGGCDPEASRQVFEAGGLDFIAERPEEMLGRVDAVMITARDGQYHADFARPFIEAGLPAFIDKPFTRDPQQALALARLAKERGVPLVGGSSVKLSSDVEALRVFTATRREKLISGDIAAPLNMINEYGGFDFYSSHLIECVLTVFGYSPEWVWATENHDNVTAVLHYPDYDVTGHFLNSTNSYSGAVFTRSGVMQTVIHLDDVYQRECRSFARILRTGEMDGSYEQLVAPVFCIEAIRRSFETGEKQPVPAVIL